MHRLTFFVTIAVALAACGDDTSGSGGSSSQGGGSGTGGDAATTGTTTATTTGGDGGGTTTTTGSGGAEEFQSLIDACEGVDDVLRPFSDTLACGTPIAAAACDEYPTDYAGCETEAETWLDCFASEATIDDCSCNANDAFECLSPAACSDDYDAFTACAF